MFVFVFLFGFGFGFLFHLHLMEFDVIGRKLTVLAVWSFGFDIPDPPTCIFVVGHDDHFPFFEGQFAVVFRFVNMESNHTFLGDFW